MALLKNGMNLFDTLAEYVNNSASLFIFVPYIKKDALVHLIDEAENCKAIFVRWNTDDLVTGVSDLDIYPYCKQRGITLYRNKRLHLKAFIDSYKKCLLGSANISGRALNIPSRPDFNYELATIINDLSIDDRLYFSIIETDSTLITDNIYNQFVEQLKGQAEIYKDRIGRDVFKDKSEHYKINEGFDIQILEPDKDFLISSLPMSLNVETLYRVYETQSAINEVELNCAVHDLAIYKIPLGLSPDEFRLKLKKAFFEHPFIKAFLNNLNSNGEIYFGTAKAWIQSSCSNVPTPRRWEITENIQILYKWIVKLGEGHYEIDIPGSWSERLKKVK